MTKHYSKEPSKKSQREMILKAERNQAFTEADFYMHEYLQLARTPAPWSWVTCIIYSLSGIVLSFCLQSHVPIILTLATGAGFFYLRKNFVYGSSKLI